MRFIITVDTEADNQWKGSSEITLNNLATLPRFQDLCQKYGFVPTYLVTYEVAANESAVNMLKKWQNEGLAEIGAHLHPWTNPPYENEQDKQIQRFPSYLPKKVLANKLKSLTEKISSSFGRVPTSFRAGRWGFNGEVLKQIESLGYLVDCSVTPKIDWRRLGGPNFKRAPVVPYNPLHEDVRMEGESKVLELPMTILTIGIFRKKWLRIFPASTKEDWVSIYARAKKLKLPYLQFMIHSSELMEGGSPVSKTKERTEHVWEQLEIMFAYFKRKDLKPETLTSFATSYKRNE